MFRRTPKKDLDKLKETPEELMSYAVYLLSKMDYSEASLLDKVESYALRVSDAGEVIEKLKELGYINDERYAENVVRSKSETYGYGPIRIRQYLSQKGVDNHLINISFEQYDSEYWKERCLDVYSRRFFDIPSSIKEKQKRMRWLANKGFSFDMINYAMKELENNEY